MYLTGVGPMGSDRVAPCQAQPFSRAPHQPPIAIVRIVTLVKCHARDDTPITASPSDAARWLPYLACSHNYSPHQLEYSPHQLAHQLEYSPHQLAHQLEYSPHQLARLARFSVAARACRGIEGASYSASQRSSPLDTRAAPCAVRVRANASLSQRVHPTSAALSARSRSHA